MRHVDPVEARQGDYIDTFPTLAAAEKAEARLERILRNVGSRRELVYTIIPAAIGGQHIQVFLLA